uniref:PDZ domain-containing protein n=1 Tax=Ascaris lumbricoides TaxID=6252 RepID=A0A0M3IC99_ASCLU
MELKIPRDRPDGYSLFRRTLVGHKDIRYEQSKFNLFYFSPNENVAVVSSRKEGLRMAAGDELYRVEANAVGVPLDRVCRERLRVDVDVLSMNDSANGSNE